MNTPILTGDLVRLRACADSDTAILDAELHDDVENWARSSWQPWRPVAAGAEASPHRVTEPAADRAAFAAVELATDTLVGMATLGRIDKHHQCGIIGLSLRPSSRGKGFDTDVLRVLCRYGFTVLGLHSVGLGTLVDNHAMVRAAEQVGFRRAGVQREVTWIMGRFADAVLFDLLASEWTATT